MAKRSSIQSRQFKQSVFSSFRQQSQKRQQSLFQNKPTGLYEKFKQKQVSKSKPQSVKPKKQAGEIPEVKPKETVYDPILKMEVPVYEGVKSERDREKKKKEVEKKERSRLERLVINGYRNQIIKQAPDKIGNLLEKTLQEKISEYGETEVAKALNNMPLNVFQMCARNNWDSDQVEADFSSTLYTMLNRSDVGNEDDQELVDDILQEMM